MEISNLSGQPLAGREKGFKAQESVGGKQEAQKMLESTTRESEQQSAARQSAAREQLMRMAAEMNEMTGPLHTRISFGFSEDASAMYLNVIDGDSGKVIRQFPSEEALEFAAKMREFVGMLLDKRI